MKKVLSIVALVACVAVLSTSCVKSCDCKDYDADGSLIEEYSLPKLTGSGWKCSDYNSNEVNYIKTVCE